jgi:predicted  nucleic acid-binding Zn-ribbon protein
MPHQCLKCGHVFEEGSAQLLKGCPICKGNRFFFTKEPLDEAGREAISKQVGTDINTRLMEILGEDNKDLLDHRGKWITLTPKDIRRVLQHSSTDDSQGTQEKLEKVIIDQLTDDAYREAMIDQVKDEGKRQDTPETIGIEKPGKYHIDVKGLLEEEPIIIQKDGSYTIHLPSLFNMIKKKDE